MERLEQTPGRCHDHGGRRRRGRMSLVAMVVAGVIAGGAGPAGADPAAPAADSDPAAGSTTTTEPPSQVEPQPEAQPEPSPSEPQAQPGAQSQPQPQPTPEGSSAGNAAAGPAEPEGAPPSPDERVTLAYVRDPRTPRQHAAAYAYRWALSTNPDFAFAVQGRVTVPKNNHKQRGRAVDERNSAELDCTSFVSQALRAGGFDYTKKWKFDSHRRTATVAWVRAGGKDSLAPLFMKLGRMHLLNPAGAGPGQAPPAGIQIGDVIGWDPYVRSHEMHIDHQLVVTEVTGAATTWADIHVSYHTYDHRNRAMDEYAATYRDEIASVARLYVFHVRYPRH